MLSLKLVQLMVSHYISIHIKIVEELYKIIERSRLEPKLVYAEPLSVNHEYGWISTPLVSSIG